MIVALLSGMQMMADDVVLPRFASSGTTHKWYYMRSLKFPDRMLTAREADLYNEEKAAADNYDDCQRQMWCITSEDGVNFTFVNKYDGRQIDVGLSKRWSNWESLQMADVAQAKFSLEVRSGESGDTIRLVSDRPAPGGGDIFRYPAGTDATYNYYVWLVREAYSHDDASFFILEPALTDEGPEMSGSETRTYYRIMSARSGSEDMALKDNTAASDAVYKFITTKDATDHTSEWYFSSAGSGRTVLRNRATGNILSPAVDVVDEYNVPTVGSDDAAAVWVLNAITSDEYTIGGTAGDGVTRYLSNPLLGEPQMQPVAAELSGSAFAWKFVKTEMVNSIENARETAPIVTVTDGRVSVSGNAKAEIYTVDGVKLPFDTVLKSGIYIICVNGKSQKITVK